VDGCKTPHHKDRTYLEGVGPAQFLINLTGAQNSKTKYLRWRRIQERGKKERGSGMKRLEQKQMCVIEIFHY
jgi:hypothetical protein